MPTPPPSQSAGYVPPGFLAYLPSPSIAFWERWWMVGYPVAPALGQAALIGEERVPDDLVLVITDFSFYATRVVAADNPILMDQGELLRTIWWRVVANGSPLYSFGTTGVGVASRVGFTPMPRVDQRGFSPGFYGVVRGGVRVGAEFMINAAPTVTPNTMTVRICGYTMPLVDFQRSLVAGSHF